jgi:hypothetical protein
LAIKIPSRFTQSHDKTSILKAGMVSYGLLRRVALVRTDVSEEPGASFILHSHRRENLKSYILKASSEDNIVAI